jgi:hypothetical protein
MQVKSQGVRLMDEKELIAWLMENGGAAIKFRTAAELMDDCPESIKKDLADQLMENEKVKASLPLLDNFAPVPYFEHIRDFCKIHSSKSTDVEGIVPRLLNMGLRKGMPAFDERMLKFRKYVDNDYVNEALNKSQDVPEDRHGIWYLFTAVLLASYFVWGGYAFEESINMIKRQINLLHKTASQKIFDIYLTEGEKKDFRLRIPKGKEKVGVIKSGIDLPLIYDLFHLAYLPEKAVDNELRQKIDTIIEYILEEKFQSLDEGYGYVFYKSEKGNFYNVIGCGWRPVLPCFFNFDSERHLRTIVLYLNLMAHFEPAVQSNWFKNCLEHLEQYQTDTGTYRFPPNYLLNKKDGFFVMGGMMGLEDRRTKKGLELESTFWMLLIKKTMRKTCG